MAKHRNIIGLNLDSLERLYLKNVFNRPFMFNILLSIESLNAKGGWTDVEVLRFIFHSSQH